MLKRRRLLGHQQIGTLRGGNEKQMLATGAPPASLESESALPSDAGVAAWAPQERRPG